jgi:hypothetical protein
MVHENSHKLSGKTVKLKNIINHPQYDLNGADYIIEDWQDRVMGQSWMFCSENPVCLIYAMRSAFSDLPTDDNVLYGKVNGLGHIIHISEIEDYDKLMEV